VLNRLFGVTLWCKTLVLRKDKVTHCVVSSVLISSVVFAGHCDQRRLMLTCLFDVIDTVSHFDVLTDVY